jgi:hypothetical protein
MSNGKVTLVIPRHNPVNAFTMGSIAADAGMTPEEFNDCCNWVTFVCAFPRLRYIPSRSERTLSSVVEHYLHTVGVAGSKPAASTIFR